MFQSRYLRAALVILLVAMIFVFLSDWSTASRQVRIASVALSAILALFAVGIATQGRAMWALRVSAGTIGLGYLVYFFAELRALLHGEPQRLEPGQPSATMAGLGVIVYAVPFLIFAISGFVGARWRTLHDWWIGRDAGEDRGPGA
jgi:hypothetical protein